MDFLGYTTVNVFVCAQVRNLQLGLTAGYRGAAFANFGISSTFKRIVFLCQVGLPTLTVTMSLSDSQVLLLLVHRHQKPPRRFIVRVLSKSSRSILFSISKPLAANIDLQSLSADLSGFPISKGCSDPANLRTNPPTQDSDLRSMPCKSNIYQAQPGRNVGLMMVC